ncbi:uncharacterized protein RBU57_013101 isoform 7-T8 [Macrochelys suwanniensis]
MLPDSAGDAPLAGLTRAGDGAGASSRRSEVQPAPLPFYRKLCYAIGGAPYQMTGNALGFFLQIFLLDVVQLEPFHSSLILFLGRAWDAVTDPAVGFLVSKSPRRKLGKLIPWIVFSTPFGVVFYCMVWFTPSDTMPVSLKFLWYLAMYCFFQTSMSCYHVPYSSLTMFLGGNQRDRDSATAYRMGVEVFSTLVGSGIQGQIVGRYHASMMESCSVLNGTLYNSTSPGLTDTSENTGVRDRLRGPGLALLHGLPDSLPRCEGAARAPQPLGKGPAALLSQPADNPGTPALCLAALWLPLHVPGLPGRGVPLHSLLAVVSGAFWEKTSCVRGPITPIGRERRTTDTGSCGKQRPALSHSPRRFPRRPLAGNDGEPRIQGAAGSRGQHFPAARATSRGSHWPGTANHGYGELREAGPALPRSPRRFPQLPLARNGEPRIQGAAGGRACRWSV